MPSAILDKLQEVIPCNHCSWQSLTNIAPCNSFKNIAPGNSLNNIAPNQSLVITVLGNPCHHCSWQSLTNIAPDNSLNNIASCNSLQTSILAIHCHHYPWQSVTTVDPHSSWNNIKLLVIIAFGNSTMTNCSRLFLDKHCSSQSLAITHGNPLPTLLQAIPQPTLLQAILFDHYPWQCFVTSSLSNS